MSQTEQVIPWYRLRAYLEEMLSRCGAKLVDASGEELFRTQGEARLLRRLLNLPEALALVQEEDERAEQEKSREQAKREVPVRAAVRPPRRTG